MISLRSQESLLIEVSRRLRRKITAYAIGGNAMMIWGLKDSTVDVDIVFESEAERQDFIAALKSLGFEGMDPSTVYGTKKNKPLMLRRAPEERFDLFLREVIKFEFSQGMRERSEKTFEFGGMLTLKAANYHDIILMKSSTDRERDKEDIKNILDGLPIDWNIIAGEAKHQISIGKWGAVFCLYGTLRYMKENMKAQVPPRFLDVIWKMLDPGSPPEGYRADGS